MHGGIHREKACKGTTFFWNVQILSKKSNNLWGFVNKLAYFLPKSDTHSSKYNALPPILLLPYGGSDCVCWWHKFGLTAKRFSRQSGHFVSIVICNLYIIKLSNLLCMSKKSSTFAPANEWRHLYELRFTIYDFAYKKRALSDSSSGWQDSNLRPPVPQTVALPDCATSRCLEEFVNL